MACTSQVMPEVQENRLKTLLHKFTRFYRSLNCKKTSVKFYDFVRSHIFISFQHITISNVATVFTGWKRRTTVRHCIFKNIR